MEYYNVNVYPFPMIDGIIQPNWSSYQSYASAIEERKAIATNYSLNFNVQGNGTDYQATVAVGQINPNNANKVLHVVLTESHIPESWYGGEEINFVTRLMLPDQYGTPLLSKPTFEFEFTLQSEWVADSCELVAFIQDTVTKEIYQAKSFLLSDAILTFYDVALDEIVLNSDEYCTNQIAPKVIIRNQSFENLTNCIISYEINGELFNYNWEGNLEPDSAELVILPEVNFTLLDENLILVNVSLPNGEIDENPDNNILEEIFYEAQIIEKHQLIFELLTDDLGGETSWELNNSEGELVYSGEGYNNNTLYTIDLEFSNDDCYEFIIYDEGGNGICCDNGNGYFLIKDSDGIVYIEGGEFTSMKSFPLQIDVATAVNNPIQTTDLFIYPNPASDHIFIKSITDINTVRFYNAKGENGIEESVDSKFCQFDTRQLLPGLYFLRIETSKDPLIQRIIIK